MSRDVPSLRRVERLLKTLVLSVLRGIFRSRRVPPFDPARFSRILVIRQHNQLGDMLCVTPLLRALRARYPDAFLALLTSPVNHEVMLHHAALDTVINFDKRDFLRGKTLRLAALWRFIRSLRALNLDLVLVPATVSTSTTSDVLAYVTGARTRIGAGSINGKSNPSSFLYTHERHLAWTDSPARHQTDRNMDIADLLGLPAQDRSLDLTLTPGERSTGLAGVRELTGNVRPVIAYHVGAGKPPNRWPADKFAALINLLGTEFRAAALLISGPMDEESVSDVAARLGVPYYLIEKQSIRTVASCLASVDLLVSNDTGIMHVGA
ncbi:MAG TPA: glycosyltransferase family 9 protein, partial [Bacteroidota bacterium]|nr:glycosyltransferase family 9 protein [Bacteroidota bacterium]